jgi:alkanesulfonate monooxygenase SsuD/methylene tetrahydromethanopterin reductase-like flavin-dependent oxidoreductase (luciferase family)
MRFDLLYALLNPGNRLPWDEVLGHARDHVALADDLGYGAIWLGEHHFDIEGIDQVPNPIMLGADLASRTRRIRIAIGAISLTLWHPLRVAEDLAMLDQLSGGRLDVSFGRGIILRDIMNLNAAADRRDEKRSREIFLEHLEIVRRAWTQDTLRWEGERFTIPHPGVKSPVGGGAPDPRFTDENGDVVALGLVPRPLQDPHPPLFTVSEAPAGFDMAAAHDMRPITWLPTGSGFHSLLETYADARERHTGARTAHGEDCAALRLCLVAESDEEARRIAEPAINDMFELMTRIRGRKIWLDHGEDENASAIVDAKPFDLLLERDHLFIGGPESVAERINRMVDTYGVRHWLLQMTLPGVDHEDVATSIRLFSDAVMPLLHSPTAVTH